MNKLYFFAIGGSGERVFRSLVMTLSSGMSIGARELVPVFMDTDVGAEALTHCLKLIHYYNAAVAPNNPNVGANSLYSVLGNDEAKWPSFFRTRIAEPILLNNAGANIGNLRNVIGTMNQDDPVHRDILEERELLFTDDDLDMRLTVGFVGNPNIGSVVLNSLSLADDSFDEIYDTITSNDGVFVAGSLFGGTGAAGFPLIINKFKEKPIGNQPILGGVAVLPYFVTTGIDGTGGLIDTEKYNVNSESFDTKTRAAIMHYGQYMRNMDFLYYVGDKDKKDVFRHYVGGPKQQNPTHLVELMSALCAIDFSRRQKPDSIVYKIPIWGINTTEGAVPTNFSGMVNSELKISLAKFEMMVQMFKCTHPDDNFLSWSIAQKKDYVANIGFDDARRESVANPARTNNYRFAWGVSNLISEWQQWINELGRNSANRKFAFFNDGVDLVEQDVTTHFYSEEPFGIAKFENRRIFNGPLCWERRDVPVDAGINAELQKAYLNLRDELNIYTPQNVDEPRRLPVLLKIISDALDEVIKNNCVTM